MTSKLTTPSGLILLLLVGLLILTGYIVDVGFAQPQLRRLNVLERQRSELQTRIRTLEQRTRRADDLAAYHGANNPSSALHGLSDLDPVSYLSGLVREARLTQQELGTEKTNDFVKLRGTQYYLRLYGTYGRFLDFVRSVEESITPASIDAVLMKKESGSSRLETRFKITLYEPIPARPER